MLQVEGDRSLVARLDVPPQAVAVFTVRSDVTEGVSVLRLLDLDHLGAEVRKQGCRHRARHHRADVNSPDAGQRSVAAPLHARTSLSLAVLPHRVEERRSARRCPRSWSGENAPDQVSDDPSTNGERRETHRSMFHSLARRSTIRSTHSGRLSATCQGSRRATSAALDWFGASRREPSALKPGWSQLRQERPASGPHIDRAVDTAACDAHHVPGHCVARCSVVRNTLGRGTSRHHLDCRK